MLDEMAIIPWYPDELSYEQFRQTAIDRELFFETYETWRQAALEHERQAEQWGVVVLRSRVDYGLFESWLNRFQRVNDQHARSDFAKFRAQQNLGDRS